MADESTQGITEQQKDRIKQKLNEINKALLTMEWDKKHNQFNAGMEEKYTELKEEQNKLQQRIEGGTTSS